MAKCRTQKYYDKNPAARKKKADYQKAYNAKPSEKKRRSKLNKENRRRGTYGNGDKLDVAHTKRGFRLRAQSLIRGDKNDMSGDRRARG